MTDSGGRGPRTVSRLIRYGFADSTRAADLLGPTGLGLWPPSSNEQPDRVLEALATTADPDLALLQLNRIVEASRRHDPAFDLVAELRQDEPTRARLFAVLGASSALGDHLVANPSEWRALEPVGLVQDVPERLLAAGNPAELRIAYRRELLRIAADDLTGVADVDATMAALSGLADATLQAAYALAGGNDETRLAVVAMGKCGGNELNYVSDVDVIFVGADTDDPAASAPVAVRLMQICDAVAWPVDAALRPEGSRGPLVRTLAGHLAYYRKWARTWEFQALLKARPAAGDVALGTTWRASLQELIWHAAERPEAVADIRAMRRRIIDSVPRGRGRPRDQAGSRRAARYRVRGAVVAARTRSGGRDAALAVNDRGVDRVDRRGIRRPYGREALLDAYRFLRIVEHRLQLQRLRRTHTVPRDPDELRWLAQAMGYRANADRDAVTAFRSDWVGHSAEVRRLHAKLLYRPLLEAVARVPSDDLRLTPNAARKRLEVLGFADPAGALRHLQALIGGVSRTASIQRTLLPALLSEFADEPEPDRGLLAYRQVSESLGSTPWYLRLLRDEGPVALRLAEVLGRSRYATDLLTRDPEALRLLADNKELVPRPTATLSAGFAAAAARHPNPAAAGAAIRALRRRELFRISCADLLNFGLSVDAEEKITAIGTALTDVTDATLQATLSGAVKSELRFAIIGMGRLGGQEMRYASDADVLFVYEPPPGMAEDAASGAALAVAEQVRNVLATPTTDPPLVVDADLRPEGRQGPLVRSLAAYQQYYARWSKVWEAQALLRARFVGG